MGDTPPGTAKGPGRKHAETMLKEIDEMMSRTPGQLLQTIERTDRLQ